MQKTLAIALSPEKIVRFCQKYHIRKLSVFGSVLRDDFSDESDIDFLVEFEPEYIPGYIRLAGMEIELSEIIDRKADLRTISELSRYFRQQVLKEAKIQYVKN
ncbi:nucleotidyltransferase family protein [Spirulina sp. 06S082]|uniref:nucleotidyltransferase family protein n=1 Tax=Spirulina sp. 06S082 TaxID=3110248 RepID=UPI002B21D931|nr:nucleotidyltransferase family protein [Spirulina sp. 06S082]MEA5469854.1 nucleotidyltransferase family protein [Spirulina sp. 06S082]